MFVSNGVFLREDLRRWFIQQEVDLFRYRFNELPAKQKLEFLHNNNLQYDTVSSLFEFWMPVSYFSVDKYQNSWCQKLQDVIVIWGLHIWHSY